jgi:hypothetical protein
MQYLLFPASWHLFHTFISFSIFLVQIIFVFLQHVLKFKYQLHGIKVSCVVRINIFWR